MNTNKKIIVGIDATNIRRGGGLTHLCEMLSAARPFRMGVKKVVIFAGEDQLKSLPDRNWLVKYTAPEINGGFLRRILWQRFQLANAVRSFDCDVLFAPGGSSLTDFKPVVTMSQNLLPFEIQELLRFGISKLTIKLILLRWIQSKSFIKSDGIIFLTDYAKRSVLKVVGKLDTNISIIPHGLNIRFRNQPKKQLEIKNYNESNRIRILYVSIIDQYKHQWHVIDAIARLRQLGLPVSLDLIGPAYLPALTRLNKVLKTFDPEGNWARFHGEVPFDELHQYYADADIGLFASSCENLPNILLEKMAAGLPIACSNRGPMPEVLGEAGIYFDPLKPNDIKHALYKLIESPQLRTRLANLSYERTSEYTWQRCADETFRFLEFVVKNFQSKIDNHHFN